MLGRRHGRWLGAVVVLTATVVAASGALGSSASPRTVRVDLNLMGLPPESGGARASVSAERALRCGRLPLHPTARSRTYAEVRDAAATALAGTPRDRLLEMGRTAVIPSGAGLADITHAFAIASAGLRAVASTWAEDALDRHALAHPLMGELTVREMLLFFVVHERHHLKVVRTRLASQPSTEG